MPAKTDRSVVLIACACAIFWPGSFIFGFPGMLRQHWQQAFDADGGAVGGTVFFILAGATCFMYLCGRWQERYGPGRLAGIGALMGGGSAIWLSQAGNMIDVNVWAFSVGASSAFVYLPGLTVVQRWYPENRGLVAGCFNMSFGLSAAIISPVFTFGTLFAVSGPLAGDCFGMGHFGAIFGLVFTAYGFVAGPLGPWLSGYLLDITRGNYTLVFTFLGLMYLGAASLILMVQPWRECRINVRAPETKPITIEPPGQIQ